jgi:6-phosphogluconolactonase
MTAAGGVEVVVRESADALARFTAARLVATLAGMQARGRTPSVVLTGGGVADLVHRAVLDDDGLDAVDWTRVEIWFGDERFVPEGDPDRNVGQARAALLDHLHLSAAQVHTMPAAGGRYGDDVEAAAQAYAREIGRVLGDDPVFDVLMLGVGPDGHCASLFPGRAEVAEPGPVIAVHDSPKPPPTRISLAMPLLSRAREVWFVVSGTEKAGVVRQALHGAGSASAADVAQLPAAGPHGIDRTVWLLDADAASTLPAQR